MRKTACNPEKTVVILSAAKDLLLPLPLALHTPHFALFFYLKITFNPTTITINSTANASGRFHHGKCPISGLGVSE